MHSTLAVRGSTGIGHGTAVEVACTAPNALVVGTGPGPEP